MVCPSMMHFDLPGIQPGWQQFQHIVTNSQCLFHVCKGEAAACLKNMVGMFETILSNSTGSPNGSSPMSCRLKS